MDSPSSRLESETPSDHERVSASPAVEDDEPAVITDLLAMHSAKRLKVEARKLDGMQRELYSLIGENQPPVVVGSTARYKSRPDWQQKAAPWKLAEFVPKNGLILRHWVRSTSVADGTSGDRFVRFNTPSQVPEWTDDDFEFFPPTGEAEARERRLLKEKEKQVQKERKAKEKEEKETQEKEMEEKEKEEDEKHNTKEAEEENKDKKKKTKKEDKKKKEEAEVVEEYEEEDVDQFVPWTKEETQYLFDLAREYDVRWLVMADRYKYPNRSVEDMKQRYYDCCRSLIQNRAVTRELGLNPHDEELLAAMQFNKPTEEKRKSHLERLLSRNPKEVAEEEALILEARRLESMSERLFGERREIMRLLEAPPSLNIKPKYDVSTSHGVGQLLQELQTEKGKKSSTPMAASKGSNTVTAIVGHKLPAKEMLAFGIAYTEPGKIKHPGVYVRSAKLVPIRQNILPKVTTILTELGVPLKPVMPTVRMCSRYEAVYASITLLLDAKKVQDRLELEIEVLKKARNGDVAMADVEAPTEAEAVVAEPAPTDA